MDKHGIEQIGEETYDEILYVWERSVRATHDFLSEDDIAYYKLRIPEYFSQVRLYAIQYSGQVQAFMGLSDNKIEMLFVLPESRGKGLGKKMVRYALLEKNIMEVDVNEQNLQACGFYEKMGFTVISRDSVDGEGKPFPILHLRYEE